MCRFSGFLAGFVLMTVAASASAQDDVTPLSWARLVPPPTQAELKSRSFVAGARPFQQGSEPPPPAPKDQEAAWLSQKSLQPGTGGAAPVVKDLDGKRVRIGGYVVALDFDATSITEFLLVPYVGACIHVPPPPPNQIIYVKSTKGFEIKGQFDPVYVTGTLRTSTQHTGLAETGYVIDGGVIEARPGL